MRLSEETVGRLTEAIGDDIKRCLMGFLSFEIENKALSESIKVAWNYVLDNHRASTLADAISKHLNRNSQVLDMLSGTGTLASSLRGMNFNVLTTERLDEYPDLNNCDFQYPAIPDDLRVDAVLLVTVLHHEPDFRELLTLATKFSNKIIVVENTIDEFVTQELHNEVDYVFNSMVNDFGCQCPGNHQSTESWHDEFGILNGWSVTASKNIGSVPGVPLPHHLFVLEREYE